MFYWSPIGREPALSKSSVVEVSVGSIIDANRLKATVIDTICIQATRFVLLIDVVAARMRYTGVNVHQ
jgi:hypothetical protein